MRGVAGKMMLVLAGLALAGCADRGLRTLQQTGSGPDEFMIMPAKPLTPPTDYAFLPPPTPGGTNLTDQNPKEDAIVALGGRPQSRTGSVPAGDAALVRQATRYGVAPDTRQVLAEDDAAFRRRQGRLSSVRLFPVDRYSQAYRREMIDPFAEAELLRRSGIKTPTSPPSN